MSILSCAGQVQLLAVSLDGPRAAFGCSRSLTRIGFNSKPGYCESERRRRLMRLSSAVGNRDFVRVSFKDWQFIEKILFVQPKSSVSAIASWMYLRKTFIVSLETTD